MDLREYGKIIINTTLEDWKIFQCWGYGSGPSYLQSLSVWTTGQGEFSNIDIESHSMRACLKNDLSIWIASGYPHNPDFKESWANQFPDPHASSGIIDFFYNSNLVFRDIYVSVDGGRCRLPLPNLYLDNKKQKYSIQRDKYNFFRMLDGFDGYSQFDEYFEVVDFDIVDEPWME